MAESKKTLWKLLWDYDPNGLLVVDTDCRIKIVNQALCQMIGKQENEILGEPVTKFFEDLEDFQYAWASGHSIKAKEKNYPQYDLHVRKVLFPIKV